MTVITTSNGLVLVLDRVMEAFSSLNALCAYDHPVSMHQFCNEMERRGFGPEDAQFALTRLFQMGMATATKLGDIKLLEKPARH